MCPFCIHVKKAAYVPERRKALRAEKAVHTPESAAGRESRKCDETAENQEMAEAAGALQGAVEALLINWARRSVLLMETLLIRDSSVK